MRIFISHKDVDAETAKGIARVLDHNGISYYLDVVDNSLANNPGNLTEHILGQMGRCSHLLAVISEATRLSWWVPFEIGLATEKGFTIASYVKSHVQLPDYLKGWPYLNSDGQITTYINQLNRSGLLVESFSERSTSGRIKDAGSFHRALKQTLGQ